MQGMVEDADEVVMLVSGARDLLTGIHARSFLRLQISRARYYPSPETGKRQR